MPPELARLFKSPQRLATFEKHVRLYFERRDIAHTIEDGTVYLAMDGRPLQYGLDNIAQACASADDQEMAALIADHFDTIERTAAAEKRIEADIDNFEQVRSRIVVLLYPSGGLPDATTCVRREHIPGIEAFLGLDLGESLRTVDRNTVNVWGRPSDELFELAFSNAAARARPDNPVDVGGDGRVVILHDASILGAARTIAEMGFPDRHGPYGALISIPTKHLTILAPFTGSETLELIGPVMRMASSSFDEGPRSLSPNVYWLHQGKWLPIPYRITRGQIDINPPQELAELIGSLQAGNDVGDEDR